MRTRTTPNPLAGGAAAPSARLAPAHEIAPGQATLEDQDTGDLDQGVDEDALNDDDLDTDQIAVR